MKNKINEKSENNSLFYILTALIITVLLISGCGPAIPPGTGTNTGNNGNTNTGTTPIVTFQPGTYNENVIFDPKAPVNTKSFSSIEEYKEFVKRYQSSGYYGGYYGGYRGEIMFANDAMMEKSVSSSLAPQIATTSGGSAANSNQYSQTNNQVESVDEADLIKTDGDYIYTITDNTVFVIKAYPGKDAEIVSKIKYDDNRPTSVFIKGNYLAVFGDFSNLEFFKNMDFKPRYGMTFFNIYDISDRENPKLVKEYKFEGNYFNARMAGDYVYFIVTQQQYYRPDYPTPILFEGNVKRMMPVGDIYYYNIPYQSPQLVTIHSINIAKPTTLDVKSKSVAVEGSQNMYMSENNIFITYTEFINEYDLQNKIMITLLEDKLTDADRKLVEKIKSSDSEVLSQYEKQSKISQIYMSYLNYLSTDERDTLQDKADELLKKKLDEYEHFEFTVINKISVKNGEIEVMDNGKVPGHIINQFSLDEKDDILRIATTLSARWSSYGRSNTKSTNNVYALDSKLKVIGELLGLAEDEQIYSTRFIDNRLYMVTFRQVDPFFVIDLSKPANIKELGKLKIPGFSRYLHPYDENTIIGIGQDATDMGRTKGLKISLFDVKDVSNPKETAKFVTEEKYAKSSALYEHKAFLFSREKELLVIPVYNYDYDYRGGSGKGYNGAFVFKITKNEISLRGLIDHSMAGDNNYYYQPMVERSLWINELLYTKSPNLLRINAIGDLKSVKNLTLEVKSTNVPIY